MRWVVGFRGSVNVPDTLTLTGKLLFAACLHMFRPATLSQVPQLFAFVRKTVSLKWACTAPAQPPPLVLATRFLPPSALLLGIFARSQACVG